MNIITNPEGRVLSQLPGTPTYWSDRQLSECLAFKYAVRFDTTRGARQAAAMHGGTVEGVR